MGDIIHLPTPLTARSARVDALCAAVAHGKAARPLVDVEELDGAVELHVGDVVLHLTPEDALEVSNRIATAAGDALARRKR